MSYDSSRGVSSSFPDVRTFKVVLPAIRIRETAVSSLFVQLLIIDTILAAGSIAIGLILHSNPSRYFGESSPATCWSFGQLILPALLCYEVFRVRREQSRAGRRAGPYVIWLLIAAGFLFLAADEILQIHERLDHSMHRLLGVEETGFTDHLDELILGLYGVFGVLTLWICRTEVLHLLKYRSFLATGVVLFFVMLFFDFMSNGDEEYILPQYLLQIFKTLEDTIKLYGETFFVVAFADCCWRVRREACGLY